MKKVLLIALMLGLMPCHYAQDIPNGKFENWFTEDYFEEPDEFSTTNIMIYWVSAGEENVTKTTESHSGNYAIRLETIIIEEDTLPGMAFLGNFLIDGNGGIPYTDRPDSINGYVKYDMMPDDTAFIASIFLNQGDFIGVGFHAMAGTQNDYIAFASAIQWINGATPDTMLLRIISSGGEYAKNGSVVYADDIRFSGGVQQIPNGDMENWTMLSAENPEDWTTLNFFGLFGDEFSTTKTTDSYEGSFALQIKTVMVGEDTSGVVTNGTFGEDGPIGGLPVNLNPQMLTGYYKFYPVGPDTALAALTTFRYNPELNTTEMIEEAIIQLNAAEEWTFFEINLHENPMPMVDTMNIAFASSNLDDDSSYYIGLGSILILDDLMISYFSSDITESSGKYRQPVLYPNPSNDYLYVQFAGASSALFRLYDLNGSCVINEGLTNLNNGPGRLDLSGISHGVYCYEVILPDKVYSGKICKKR